LNDCREEKSDFPEEKNDSPEEKNGFPEEKSASPEEKNDCAEEKSDSPEEKNGCLEEKNDSRKGKCPKYAEIGISLPNLTGSSSIGEQAGGQEKQLTTSITDVTHCILFYGL